MPEGSDNNIALLIIQLRTILNDIQYLIGPEDLEAQEKIDAIIKQNDQIEAELVELIERESSGNLDKPENFDDQIRDLNTLQLNNYDQILMLQRMAPNYRPGAEDMTNLIILIDYYFEINKRIVQMYKEAYFFAFDRYIEKRVDKIEFPSSSGLFGVFLDLFFSVFGGYLAHFITQLVNLYKIRKANTALQIGMKKITSIKIKIAGLGDQRSNLLEQVRQLKHPIIDKYLPDFQRIAKSTKHLKDVRKEAKDLITKMDKEINEIELPKIASGYSHVTAMPVNPLFKQIADNAINDTRELISKLFEDSPPEPSKMKSIPDLVNDMGAEYELTNNTLIYHKNVLELAKSRIVDNLKQAANVNPDVPNYAIDLRNPITRKEYGEIYRYLTPFIHEFVGVKGEVPDLKKIGEYISETFEFILWSNYIIRVAGLFDENTGTIKDLSSGDVEDLGEELGGYLKSRFPDYKHLQMFNVYGSNLDAAEIYQTEARAMITQIFDKRLDYDKEKTEVYVVKVITDRQFADSFNSFQKKAADLDLHKFMTTK